MRADNWTPFRGAAHRQLEARRGSESGVDQDFLVFDERRHTQFAGPVVPFGNAIGDLQLTQLSFLAEVGGVVLHVGDLDMSCSPSISRMTRSPAVRVLAGWPWSGCGRRLTISSGFARSAANAVATSFFFRSTMSTGVGASGSDRVGVPWFQRAADSHT